MYIASEQILLPILIRPRKDRGGDGQLMNSNCLIRYDASTGMYNYIHHIMQSTIEIGSLGRESAVICEKGINE